MLLLAPLSPSPLSVTHQLIVFSTLIRSCYLERSLSYHHLLRAILVHRSESRHELVVHVPRAQADRHGA